MKVGVSLAFMTGQRGGMETYVREIYRELPEHLPEAEFIGYGSRSLAESDTRWFPGTVRALRFTSQNRLSWASAELFHVGRLARQDRVDLLHAPANFGPIGWAPPTVVTVHDLIAHRYPHYVPGPYAFAIRAMVKASARHARRVLTPSEATAGDLLSLLNISPDRIDVTPLAARATTRERVVEADRSRVIVVGNRMPHKNVEVVVRAVASMAAEKRPLVTITGGGVDDPLPALIREVGVEAWITVVGWLSEEDLERLYEHATIAVLPTRFEGFGLPVLEAMSRGVPVICSDLPVLREVAGSAALYVDTTDSAELARALEQLLSDPAALASARVDGLARAEQFTWGQTAFLTAASFRRAVGYPGAS